MRARELGPPGATSKGCGKQRVREACVGRGGGRVSLFSDALLALEVGFGVGQERLRKTGLRENGTGRGNLTPGYYLRWRASSPGCAVGEQRPSFDATVAVLSGLRAWWVGSGVGRVRGSSSVSSQRRATPPTGLVSRSSPWASDRAAVLVEASGRLCEGASSVFPFEGGRHVGVPAGGTWRMVLSNCATQHQNARLVNAFGRKDGLCG